MEKSQKPGWNIGELRESGARLEHWGGKRVRDQAGKWQRGGGRTRGQAGTLGRAESQDQARICQKEGSRVRGQAGTWGHGRVEAVESGVGWGVGGSGDIDTGDIE